MQIALAPSLDISIVRSFAILLGRKSEVEGALTALVKRATRKGIPGVMSWTWGKAYQDEVRVANVDGVPPTASARLSADASSWIIPVARVTLDLVGETPRLNGWRFLATLQHLDGENIVRCLPGEAIDASYRTRGSVCDHCRQNRRRNDTYVLRHDDGRTMQVGSSCLQDFLGGDEASMIAAKAEILALAASVASDDGEGFGGSGEGADRLLCKYLTFVSWVVRVEGWKSRTVAREQGGFASADRAWTLMTDGQERLKAACEPTAEDNLAAEGAEAWAGELSDEAVNAGTSDYLHNLRTVCRTGQVSFRTAGIAASAVTAFQRFIGQERAKAEKASQPSLDAYVGNVGEKVTFGLAPKTGKKGQPLKGSPIVLSLLPVILDFVTGYETDFGYTTVLKFKTPEGATLVWKSSGDAGVGRDDVGKRYTLSGTIKAHTDYKGAKQTLMTRCSVDEVPASTAG